MTKFVKISLAAAVAVAGMSSVASAKPLEEAIKGVDATGYVTYQYNDRNAKTTTPAGVSTEQNTTSNVYKAGITLTVPATDDVKVKVTGVARTSTQTADGAVPTQITDANFVYTGVENLTVIAGKQALNTPWTQGASNIDATQTGTGLLGLYNAGFATFAAGYITNNNIDNNSGSTSVRTVSGVNSSLDMRDAAISVVAAIVPMGEVATAQVWYAKANKVSVVADPVVGDSLNAINMSVDANLMDIARLNVTHSTLKVDRAAHANPAILPVTNDIYKKQKLTKVTLRGSIDVVNLTAAYAKTGKDGGVVAFDPDGSAGFKGYRADMLGSQDAKGWLLSANTNIMKDVNLALTHISVNNKGKAVATDDLKHSETYGQVTYRVASNLSAFVRYGVFETKRAGGNTASNGVKEQNGRLQIAYSF